MKQNANTIAKERRNAGSAAWSEWRAKCNELDDCKAGSSMSIDSLTEADKGRYVAYRPKGQPHITEIGKIKRWNTVYVWVVFIGPRRYFDPTQGERTPMACLPDTLHFIKKRSDGGFDGLDS
jgi:hypothetical protein